VTEPLPTSGPDREILLRALREYSDNCLPPALTPGCPFAFDIEPGVRGCGEECIDILARYDAPASIDEISVGLDVTIRKRRPRARRGPGPQARPFDVAEMYMIDSEVADLSKWRMPSLMEGLKRELAWQSHQDRAGRRSRISDLTGELRRRGIDVESLVRYGFATTIAVAIMISHTVARLMSDEPESEFLASHGITPWLSLIGPPQTDQDGDAEVDLEQINWIRHWVHSADLEDVFEWIPPSSLSPESPVTGVDSSVLDKAKWLADRFTMTYLQSWHTSSLKLEWLYINGRRTAPCARGDMAARRVGELELARLLADNEMDGERRTVDPSGPPLVQLALQLIEDGRRDTAAAMFEAASALSPSNPEIFNNWAFCLIPDDPEKALSLLDDAAALGMEQATTVVANRLLCYLRLERYATGLALAESMCAGWADLAGRRSFLWEIEGPPEVSSVDGLAYILDVITAIAAATSDPVIQNKWKSKVEELRTSL